MENQNSFVLKKCFIIVCSIIFLTLITISLEAISYSLKGKVISIKDGDTIWIKKNNMIYKIRLDGIDCPEKSQAFGQKAKQFTSDLCFGKTVTAIVHGKDRYNRYLAEIVLPNGKSLNRELLRVGLAWHYKKYNQDRTLAQLEEEAKVKKIGLWSDKNPMPPWSFRRK